MGPLREDEDKPHLVQSSTSLGMRPRLALVKILIRTCRGQERDMGDTVRSAQTFILRDSRVAPMMPQHMNQVMKAPVNTSKDTTRTIFHLEVDRISMLGNLPVITKILVYIMIQILVKPHPSSMSLKDNNVHSKCLVPISWPWLQILILLSRRNRPEKRYLCDYPNCPRSVEGQGFTTLNDLERHGRSIHNEAGQYIICHEPGCPEREKYFPRRDNFIDHWWRVHGRGQSKEQCKVVASELARQWTVDRPSEGGYTGGSSSVYPGWDEELLLGYLIERSSEIHAIQSGAGDHLQWSTLATCIILKILPMYSFCSSASDLSFNFILQYFSNAAEMAFSLFWICNPKPREEINLILYALSPIVSFCSPLKICVSGTLCGADGSGNYWW